MTIGGIVLFIIGIAAVIFGNASNHDVERQLVSMFQNGSTNPGSIFIIIGVALVVVGIVLFIFGMKKAKTE